MNYYNEFDPKAAAWLRELIRQGHIPLGRVDERSITEVDPDEIREYPQCHFFAGIGGWSHALELASWDDSRPVWTGSCPCQPFSSAGLGRGEADERHLWPAWFKLIRQCRPGAVLGEQVASKAALGWFDGVSSDLEAEGYAAAAFDLCSPGVGAPHIRQRLHWVAVTSSSRTGRHAGAASSEEASLCGQGDSDGVNSGDASFSRRPVGVLALAQCDAREPRGAAAESAEGAEAKGSGSSAQFGRCGDVGRLALANGRIESDGELQRSGEHRQQQKNGGALRLAHHHHKRLEIGPEIGQRTDASASTLACGAARGVGISESRRDWQTSECGSSGESAGEGRQRGLGRSSPWSDFDILPCLDGKARRVESGTFPLAHGVPGRVGLLRGYGNAINPHLAAAFIEAVMEILP